MAWGIFARPEAPPGENSGASNGDKPPLHFKEEPTTATGAEEDKPKRTPQLQKTAVDKKQWPPKVIDDGEHNRPPVEMREKKPKRRRRPKQEKTPQQETQEEQILANLLESVPPDKRKKYVKLTYATDGEDLIFNITVIGKADEEVLATFERNIAKKFEDLLKTALGEEENEHIARIRINVEDFHHPKGKRDPGSYTERVPEAGSELESKLAELSERLGRTEEDQVIWTDFDVIDADESEIGEPLVFIGSELIDDPEIIKLVNEITALEQTLRHSSAQGISPNENSVLIHKATGGIVLKSSQALTLTAEGEEEKIKRGEFRKEVREARLPDILKHVGKVFSFLEHPDFAKNADPAVKEMASLFVEKARRYSNKSRKETSSADRMRDILTTAIGGAEANAEEQHEAEIQARRIYDAITSPTVGIAKLTADGKELIINQAKLAEHVEMYLRHRALRDSWLERYGKLYKEANPDKRYPQIRSTTLEHWAAETERFINEDAAWTEGQPIPNPPPRMPENSNFIVALSTRLELGHYGWPVPRLAQKQTQAIELEQIVNAPETIERSGQLERLEAKIEGYELIVGTFEIQLATILDQEGPFNNAQKEALNVMADQLPLIVIPDKIAEEYSLEDGTETASALLKQVSDMDARIIKMRDKSIQLIESDPRMDSMESYTKILENLAANARELEAVKTELDTTKEAVATITKETAIDTKAIEHLQGMISDRDEARAEQEGQIRNEVAKDIAGLENTIDTLHRELADKDEASKRQLNTITELQAKLDRTASQATAAKEALDRSEAEIATHKQKIIELNAKLDTLLNQGGFDKDTAAEMMPYVEQMSKIMETLAIKMLAHKEALAKIDPSLVLTAEMLKEVAADNTKSNGTN